MFEVFEVFEVFKCLKCLKCLSLLIKHFDNKYAHTIPPKNALLFKMILSHLAWDYRCIRIAD
jgi:hypothetical protein